MRALHLTLAASLLATACDGIYDPALLPTAAPSLALGTQASGGCLDLDFDADGVLPGSQGMTYFSDPPGVPENASFSVAGGLLTMNTLYGGVVTGYLLPNGYDPDLDFTLEFRVRVLPGTDASSALLRTGCGSPRRRRSARSCRSTRPEGSTPTA